MSLYLSPISISITISIISRLACKGIKIALVYISSWTCISHTCIYYSRGTYSTEYILISIIIFIVYWRLILLIQFLCICTCNSHSKAGIVLLALTLRSTYYSSISQICPELRIRIWFYIFRFFIFRIPWIHWETLKNSILFRTAFWHTLRRYYRSGNNSCIWIDMPIYITTLCIWRKLEQLSIISFKAFRQKRTTTRC
jgi:hypothetical protein